MKAVSWINERTQQTGPVIREIGLSLTKEERQTIRNKLNALEERAPAISAINLTLFQLKNGPIKSSLSINAAFTKFRSISISNKVIDSVDNLIADIDRKILNWKKTRFKKYNTQTLEQSVVRNINHEKPDGIYI